MKLNSLIKSLDNYKAYSCPEGLQVEGITCNSKKVRANFIFVAVKGSNLDGHKFIQEAIDKGAKAIVMQSQVRGIRRQDGVAFIKVKDTRKALAILADKFYGEPSKKIKVVGITGTNGKTTVSYLIEALLREAGFATAVLGTINYRFKDRSYPSLNTTPGAIELESMLSDMLKEGIDYLVMEVSSHALAQHRIDGINFHSAIFTNLTQDHLDYHKTIADYFKAKARLFKSMPCGSFVILNSDDKRAKTLKELTSAQVITYGIKNKADIVARDIEFDLSHTEFILGANNRKIHLKTRLIGRHNVYNILAAVSWALKEGLDLSSIKNAIANFNLVPGRMERINSKRGFSIFVDYAHTEDALKNAIATLRELTSGRLIVVFGCGGQRDKTKRPKMGHAVSQQADYAIITNDNPRSEDPLKIIEDIKRGIKKDNYCVIPDRKEALEKSLSIAREGDTILIAGKGHENYQILNTGRINFDDREVVEECLKSMNY